MLGRHPSHSKVWQDRAHLLMLYFLCPLYPNAVLESLRVDSLQYLSGHLVHQQPRNQSLKCGAVSIPSFRLVCLAAGGIYTAVPEEHMWRKGFSIDLLHLSAYCKGRTSESHKALKSLNHLSVPYLKFSPNSQTLSKVVDLFALESALTERQVI